VPLPRIPSLRKNATTASRDACGDGDGPATPDAAKLTARAAITNNDLDVLTGSNETEISHGRVRWHSD
jgi:hypothetical protein